ncbi:hypothetical protein [Bartonella sp. CL71SXKL]
MEQRICNREFGTENLQGAPVMATDLYFRACCFSRICVLCIIIVKAMY